MKTALDVLDAAEVPPPVYTLRFGRPDRQVQFFGTTDPGFRGIPLWPKWRVDCPEGSSLAEGCLLYIDTGSTGEIWVKIVEVKAINPQTEFVSLLVKIVDDPVGLEMVNKYLVPFFNRSSATQRLFFAKAIDP